MPSLSADVTTSSGGPRRRDDAAAGRRHAKHERTLARRAAESLALVDPRDEDSTHDHHERGERRQRDDQSQTAEQLPDDEHRHDRQHRRQVDLLRHHERRNDVALDQVHDDAQSDDEQRVSERTEAVVASCR